MGERERQVYLPDDARIALMTPPKERTDQHMAALAAALELKPLFAKMPPHVRQRALQHVTLQRFDSQVRSPHPRQSTRNSSTVVFPPQYPSLPGAPRAGKSHVWPRVNSGLRPERRVLRRYWRVRPHRSVW
jgi:hypothetical protein